MSSGFVPFAEYLRSAAEAAPAERAGDDESPPAPVFACDDCAEALRAARRFRAGLADAIDAALPQLLDAIAREVLSRELCLAGADVAALVEAAFERFDRDDVVRVCVHPSDMRALNHLELARAGDSEMKPGDVRIELRSGSIDLSVASRLEAVLRVWT
jgi:flagellar biosynthesis/type III secretory pathway protein FliH